MERMSFREWLLANKEKASRDRYGGRLSWRALAIESEVPLQNLARWKDGESEPTNPKQVQSLCEFFDDWRAFDILDMSQPLPDGIDRRYIAVLMAAESNPKVRERLDQLAFEIAS